MTRALVIAAALMTLAVPRAARAQADVEEARRHFEAGVALFAEGNHEAALAELKASYALRASPVVLYNMAQTLKLLLRYEESIAAYRRYLDEGGSALPAERRRAVEVTIERLRAGTGYVVVDCAPVGSTVRIDGRTVGTTPMNGPISVAAGRRVVEATQRGRLPARREIVLTGRAVERLCLRMPSALGSGSLRVSASTSDALVSIDGQPIGHAPLEHRITGGSHRLEVTADGYDPFAAEISIVADQRRSLRVELNRRTIFQSWWFWTLTGAVVLGGAATVFVLTRPEEAPAINGNVPPGSVTAAW